MGGGGGCVNCRNKMMLTYILGHAGTAGNAKRNLKTVVSPVECSR